MVLALCVLAGYLIHSGLPKPAEPAPSPEAPFSVEPTDTATHETSAQDWGDRVEIPSLEAAAQITSVDIAGGFLTIPEDVGQVGLWTGGADLGTNTGTVFLAGHVTYGGEHGALYDLAQVQAGAEVITYNTDGRERRWQVVSLASYTKEALPSELFTDEGENRLVLVTCGGEVVQARNDQGRLVNTYSDNVVVVAVPA